MDHFHTCFVLKALAKIEALTGSADCKKAIERGVQYYIGNLFSQGLLPKPFSRRPRLTVYRHELYDLAECINLAVLLRGRFPMLDKLLSVLLTEASGKRPTARSGAVGFFSVGTTPRCIVGPSHRCSEAFAFCSTRKCWVPSLHL